MTRLVYCSSFWLAVMLSPAVLQPISCDTSGNANLVSLEVEAAGLDRVVGFSSGSSNYIIWTTQGVNEVTVRAQAAVPTAQVRYRLIVSGDIVSGLLGVGGGESTLSIPIEGMTELAVEVVDGSVRRVYTVDINPRCGTLECNDANDCTEDACVGSACDFAALGDGTSCVRGASAGTCVDGLCEPVDPGLVDVMGTFNQCPQLVSRTPSEGFVAVGLGESLTLGAGATDAEDDLIAYLWTVSAGLIVDPSTSSPTYTCTEAGTQTVTVRVSDDGFVDCAEGSSFVVACDAAP